MEDRHSDLQYALSCDDHKAILEITSKLAEGAVARDDRRHDPKSCVHEVNARFGLRGTRVGEASNPGPSVRVPRRRRPGSAHQSASDSTHVEELSRGNVVHCAASSRVVRDAGSVVCAFRGSDPVGNRC